MGYDFKEQAEKGGIGMKEKDLPGAGDPVAAGQRTSAETSGAAGRRKSGKEIVTDLLIITLGCFLLAAGIALFLDPNRLAPGGLSGVAIILNKLLPLNTGLLLLILNIPLLIVGLIKFGRQFLFSTVYATVMLSLLTDLISWIAGLFGVEAVTGDLFLASLFGGLLSGAGLGLVFSRGCTTGGLDIVVALIHKRWRHLSVGRIFLAVDFLVAAASAAVFQDIAIGLYASFGILIYSVVMDAILYGGQGEKFVYIVSEIPDGIRARILSELDIGVTDVEGVGGYTGRNKKILLVAVRKHLYPSLRDIVREEDPAAFMIVNDARAVYGEGFRSNHEDL